MIRKKLNKFLAGMMMSVMLFNSAVPYYANAEGEEYISGEENVSENEMPDTSDPEGITSEEGEDDTDDGSEREISVSEDAAEGDDEGSSIEERDIDKDEKAIEENEDDNNQPETDDVGGETLVYGNYSYSIDNEEVTITGYTGSDSEVVIPATIDDYPVKKIGSSAFAFHTEITSLVLPESIEVIDINAFSDCVALSSIIFDTNLKEIGNRAFNGCIAINSIDLPEGLEKIGESAFNGSQIKYVKIPSTISSIGISSFAQSGFFGCELLETMEFAEGLKELPYGVAAGIASLIEVKLPQSVTCIKQDAFYNDTNLSIINLPDGITEIERGAFGNCKSLSSLIIPKSTTKIDSYAFDGCVSLNSITFNNNLKEIGDEAFDGCTAIKSIDLPEGLEKIGKYAFSGSQIKYVKIPSTISTIGFSAGSSAFSGCDLLETIEFADGLKEVPGYAASDIPSLIEVILPQSVNHIGDFVFFNDTKLSVINLPDGITEIERCAFYNCKSLSNLILPESTTKIGRNAFGECVSLNSITFNNNLKEIENDAFSGCTAIKSIDLPEGLEKIGQNAFKGSQIRYVKIPSTITTIYEREKSDISAFSGCNLLETMEFAEGLKEVPAYAAAFIPSLIEVKLPQSVTCIKDNAFSNDINLSVINLPDGITEIEICAFCNCKSLSGLIIPESTTKIWDGAFDGCVSLNNITFNNNLKEIGNSAFNGCTAIKSIDMPEGLEEIGSYAFKGSQIKYVKIPSTISFIGYSEESIGSGIKGSAFSGCNLLETMEFAEGIKEVPRYAAAEIPSLIEVKLPQSVTIIKNKAFSDDSNLYDINLPDGITEIGNSAFLNCVCLGLGSVTIPQNTKTIYPAAFKGCYGLTSVSFNSSLEIIGEEAFSGCAAIHSIDLPEGLKEIGNNAFKGSQLKFVKIPSTITKLGGGDDHAASAFSGCNILETIEFENGLKLVPSYAAAGITSLKTIILPDTVTSIFEGSFLNDEKLTTIKLPDKLTSIGRRSFEGCKGITSVSFNSSLKTIEYSAFKGCISINDLVLPEELETINLEAFKGCSSLEAIRIPRSVNSIASNAFTDDSKLTIYGYADSYAQEFANMQGIPFIAIDDIEYKNGDGFDLKKNGYCIINAMSSFNYDSWTNWFGFFGYKIPLDRYQEVYGKSYTQHIYDQDVAKWDGNCYGMSATAVLFFKNQLNINDYKPGVTSLAYDGFDNSIKDGKVFLSLNKDSELTKLIERYQIWQYSVEHRRLEYRDALKYFNESTRLEDFDAIIKRIKNDKEPFLLSVNWKDDNGENKGHALVVDSSREPQNIGNGWYRIFLYDPNNPYHENSDELTLQSCYKQAANRSISVNVINGQWKMDAMVNGDGTSATTIGYDDNGNKIKDSICLFYETNGYPTNFDTKATFSSSDGSTGIMYRSDSFSVYDTNDILIYQKNNGETIFSNDDLVEDRIIYGYTVEGAAGISAGTLILPKGTYKVIVENGTIAYEEDGNYTGVVTDDKPITVFNTESNSLSVSADQSASVNIVVMDAYSADNFTSIKTDVIVDKDGCSVSLSDNKLDIDTNDDQKFNVDIITEDGKGEIKGVSSNEVEKIDLDDYVEEIVEYKISYDLDGGNVAGNPDSYTNDTESFTLINPTKEGYVFNGWTGANGDIPQLTVVIEKGTEGDLSFKANWGDPTKAVTGITLSETEIKLKKGDTGVLTVSVTPADAPISSLNWTVSDDSVASISVNGAEAKVYASKAGETSITVRTENGIEISCTVLVYDDEAVVVSEEMPLNPVPEIYEDTTELHLIKGQKFTLPDSGWTSLNKKYVAISKKNVLTAKKVTAEGIKITKDGREITIYISQPKMVKKSIKLDAGTDQSVTFDYDADNLPILWYSNAPDVATISHDGVVTAHCKGTATITAYIYGKAYTCKVKVAEPQIVQERTIHMAINKNKTVSLKGIKKPVWKAEDETVVSVKGSKFKGLKAGDTIVSTEYEGKTYQIHVYVEDLTINVTDLNAKGKDKYTAAMKVGDKIPLSYNFVEQDVVFKSSKGEVAYWDDGAIVAQMPGKAKLNAKVNGKTITINVIVAK